MTSPVVRPRTNGNTSAASGELVKTIELNFELIEELNVTQHTLFEDVSLLESQAADARKAKKEAETKTEAAIKKASLLEAENDSLRKELADLRAELEQRKQAEADQQKIHDLETSLANALSEMKSLRQEYAEKRFEWGKDKRQLEQTSQDNMAEHKLELQHQLNERNDIVARLQKEISELQHKLKEVTAVAMSAHSRNSKLAEDFRMIAQSIAKIQNAERQKKNALASQQSSLARSSVGTIRGPSVKSQAPSVPTLTAASLRVPTSKPLPSRKRSGSRGSVRLTKTLMGSSRVNAALLPRRFHSKSAAATVTHSGRSVRRSSSTHASRPSSAGQRSGRSQVA